MSAKTRLVIISTLLCVAYLLVAVRVDWQFIEDYGWIFLPLGSVLGGIQLRLLFGREIDLLIDTIFDRLFPTFDQEFELLFNRILDWIFPIGIGSHHIMAPPTQQNNHSGGNGPSSMPGPNLSRRSYADVLRRGLSFGIPLLSNLIAAREQTVDAEAATKSTLATQAVLNTPELLAMILSNLPLHAHRSHMRVCKLWRDSTRPDVAHQSHAMSGALGLRFSRSIESINEEELTMLHMQQDQASTATYRYCPCRYSWLLNLNFGFLFLESSTPEPLLAIKPFTVHSISRYSDTETVRIQLELKVGDIQSLLGLKGVTSFEQNQAKLFSNRTSSGERHNWMDIKLLNMPFKVRVAVRVDFREAMEAEGHGEGDCPMPGCQIGAYGMQRTCRDFTPEEATLGEFVHFLDRVEYDARAKARSIDVTNFLNGDYYYWGPLARRPPTIKQQYGRQYIPSSCLYETRLSERGSVVHDPRTGSLSSRLTGGTSFAGFRIGSILERRRGLSPVSWDANEDDTEVSEDELTE